LRALLEVHPRLIIQFDVLSVEQMIDYLIVGLGEYALTVYAVDHPNLVSVRIGTTPLVAVLPSGHRLATAGPLAIGELAAERIISFAPNTPHGRAIAEMTDKAGVTLDVSTRVRFAETACAFVARGLGVTIVDEQTARDSGFSGLVRMALRSAASMPIYMHRSGTVPRSKVSATFEKLCRRRAGAILAAT
jgi:DNA-binding transcriptional LysR family regulator